MKHICTLLLILGTRTALAGPPLTLIQDTLYKADGTKFEGTAFVQWKSFEAVDRSSIPMQSFMIHITAGSVRAAVVPTTNANPSAYYEVKYNSNGRTQFLEYWAVPPSSTPLRLRDVRIGFPGDSTVPAPPVNTSILIGDISGLREELDSRPPKATGFTGGRVAMINQSGQIDSVLGSPDDCVRADGTTGPCGGQSAGALGYADAETPAGAVDGANVSFSLAAAPNPIASLQVYRNGLLQKLSVDYTLSGNSLTMQSSSVPVAGDTLLAWYRTSGIQTNGYQFSDSEVPTGTIDGTNTAFQLAAVPAPTASLQVFRNGVLQKAGSDYVLTGQSLTFQPSSVPQRGDLLQASYRY